MSLTTVNASEFGADKSSYPIHLNSDYTYETISEDIIDNPE